MTVNFNDSTYEELASRLREAQNKINTAYKAGGGYAGAANYYGHGFHELVRERNALQQALKNYSSSQQEHSNFIDYSTGEYTSPEVEDEFSQSIIDSVLAGMTLSSEEELKSIQNEINTAYLNGGNTYQGAAKYYGQGFNELVRRRDELRDSLYGKSGTNNVAIISTGAVANNDRKEPPSNGAVANNNARETPPPEKPGGGGVGQGTANLQKKIQVPEFGSSEDAEVKRNYYDNKTVNLLDPKNRRFVMGRLTDIGGNYGIPEAVDMYLNAVAKHGIALGYGAEYYLALAINNNLNKDTRNAAIDQFLTMAVSAYQKIPSTSTVSTSSSNKQVTEPVPVVDYMSLTPVQVTEPAVDYMPPFPAYLFKGRKFVSTPAQALLPQLYPAGKY